MKFVIVENPEINARANVAESAVKHLGPGWKVVGETLATAVAPEVPFDPADHSVVEVRNYLDYASPEEAERVLDLERNGKARAGIVGV